jgi:apolipoprotein N-acyltransferase
MPRRARRAGTESTAVEPGVAAFLGMHPLALRAMFFAAGAMLTLAFSPVGLYALAPLLPLPLLLACLYCSPRDAARYAFWFGAGLFLFGTYWVTISVHVFGQAPLWLAVVLMLGLVLVMAAYFAATGWAIAALANGVPWRLAAAAPAAWVAIEWFRGWFLTGFPWLSVGYSQVDSPLAGWLPVVGVYGVSFLVLTSAGAFAVVLLRTGRERLAAASLALAPWLAGAALAFVPWTEPEGEPQVTTIVQGGVSQDRKWLSSQFRDTLELYLGSLREHAGSDLVVWPEVAIPARADEVEPYLELLQSMLRMREQSLLFGILEPDGNDIYNSVMAFDGARRQVYRKRHLVPFGEFFPVPDAVREWMRLMSLPYSDMSAGADVQPLLETPDGKRLAVAICYEDAYGAEQLYALPEADILINVSNDAWFGDSIAPHQHLEIARVRAVEAGRYIARATNNGISAFIAPDAAVLATAPQFEYATLTAELFVMRGATPYSIVGNWPAVLLAFALVAGLAARRAL